LTQYLAGFPHVRHADGWELVDDDMPVALGAEPDRSPVEYTDEDGEAQFDRTIVWLSEMGRSPLLVQVHRATLPQGERGRLVFGRAADAYATSACEVELVD
jgi:hypothetical protein